MNNKKGKFIVIDGTDGSGKTTQLNVLKDKLESEGFVVKIADFPQYNTKSAGLVEEYLSGKYGGADDVDPYKASIFYAVDRFDASAKIKDWLNQGFIVLANRYVSASLGHQGGKIKNPLERKLFFNWLLDLEYKIFEIPQPDLTIILHVESEISFKLAQARNREDWVGKTKDIHEDNINHLIDAEQTYLQIASSFPNFKLIKCTHKQEILSIEAIHFLVWISVSQLLKDSASLAKTDFQAVGDLIGTNQQILKYRDQVLSQANPKTNEANIQAQLRSDYSREQTQVSPQEDISSLVSQLQEQSKEKGLTDSPLKVELIHPEAKLPQKAHQDDAGFDLYSVDYYSIPAYSQALVSTGIKIQLKANQVGLIWDKSGLANQGITTMGGVIDSGYQGEIKVIVKNLSEDIFNIAPGQKIAQLLIQAIESPKIIEGKIEEPSLRQDKGFGSSGKF